MADADPYDQDLELRLANSEVVYSVQKMAECVRYGTDAERTFVLEELQQLLGHCMDDIIKSLAVLVMFPIPESAARMIAQSVVVVLRSSPRNLDEEERAFFYQAWASILVEIIPKLTITEREFRAFLKVVDDNMQSPMADLRKLAARILRPLGGVDYAKAAETLLPRILQLGEDADVTVRGTAAESMSTIGGALSEEMLMESIWPRLVGFLAERDVRIRATALRTISQVVAAHRVREGGEKKLFKEALPPILMLQLEFAHKAAEKDQRLVNDEEYTLLDVCSDVFGELLYSVSLYYQKGFRKEALKAYVGMATCNGPIIRRNTAFNMPGVSMALGDKFGNELSAVGEYLAKDKDAEVRWILSSGIHETVRVLVKSGKVEKLTKAICMLLVDKNPAVCMNTVENFSEVVNCFLESGNLDSVRQVGLLFVTLERQIKGNWRMQELLAKQIAKCVGAFSPNHIFNVVLPVLYSILEEGMPIVQSAAMSAIVESFQFFDDQGQRDEAVSRFWASCASPGKPFKLRISMIEGSVLAAQVFSRSTFCSVFAIPVLALRDDPISNVRLKLARTLTRISIACSELPEYEATLAQLERDLDPDVGEVARGVRGCEPSVTDEWRIENAARRAKEVAVFDKSTPLRCYGSGTANASASRADR